MLNKFVSQTDWEAELLENPFSHRSCNLAVFQNRKLALRGDEYALTFALTAAIIGNLFAFKVMAIRLDGKAALDTQIAGAALRANRFFFTHLG